MKEPRKSLGKGQMTLGFPSDGVCVCVGGGESVDEKLPGALHLCCWVQAREESWVQAREKSEASYCSWCLSPPD